MYTYPHLHDLYVSVSNMDTFLWLKKTHIKWPSHLEASSEKRVAEVSTWSHQNASKRFKGFWMLIVSLLWLQCDFFLIFWDLFFSHQTPYDKAHLFIFQVSGLLRQNFFSIFPFKSAKVAVDFKGALFFVQIITSKGGFSRVAVYSVLMGLVRFRVIINHGCSMVRRFPLVSHFQSSMQHKATRKIIKG